MKKKTSQEIVRPTKQPSSKMPPPSKQAAGSPPAVKPTNPPRPAKKQDADDVDRADSEGMAQPQDLPAEEPKKAPAAKPPKKQPGQK